MFQCTPFEDVESFEAGPSYGSETIGPTRGSRAIKNWFWVSGFGFRVSGLGFGV